jgi:DNA-binding NarL/FixJ family response regulator
LLSNRRDFLVVDTWLGDALLTQEVDVVVVDASTSAGTATARRLAEDPDLADVVIVGTPDTEEEVLALAQSGVTGFVDRDAGSEELIETIESCVRGEVRCAPRVSGILLRQVRGRSEASTQDVSRLTAREQEIVALIAEGLSNKEIAARLFIEVATVKNHVHNILEKLDVSRRTEAVAHLYPIATHPR